MNPSRRRYFPLFLSVILGTALSIGLYALASQVDQHRVEREFEQVAFLHAGPVQQGIDGYFELLSSIGHFYAASKEVDRDEFDQFTTKVFEHHPGLELIAWLPRVQADQLPAYYARAQKLYKLPADYRVRDLAGAELTEQAGSGDRFPVEFVEPQTGFRSLWGVDLSQVPACRAALDLARDSGKEVATAPLTVPPDHTFDALVFRPIYQNGKPHATVSERRANLFGCALMGIRFAPLLRDLRGAEDLWVGFYNGRVEAGQRIYPPAPLSANVADLNHRTPIRSWELESRPQAGFLASRASFIPWLALLVGLGFTLLLSLYLYSQIDRTLRVEEEVMQRTAELRSLNQNLSAEVVRRTQMQEELRQAKEIADAANKAKSEFLANMSHELRTPLNAIIGYSEMLSDEARELNQEDFVPDLERINAAGKHLLHLINAVLDLSKVEAGKMDLFLEEFAVADMIRDVVTLVQPLVKKNTNTLSVECPADLGNMRADLTKIRQTLLNLLSNASKFTKNGKITLTAERSGDRIQFQVRDTGIGMNPEQLGRLFQAFSQADASTTRKYGGTGLGLVISRRFCQLMGGDITVTSATGQGSTFIVDLPMRVGEETAPLPAIPEASVNGLPTVLVIDDDPSVQDLMARTLTRDGFRVIAALNGAEGLRRARDDHPDVITLDVMMPGMDGWSVLTSLKADPKLADIPVIMLTIVDERNLGFALGAHEYLSKPIDRQRLVQTLRRLRPTAAAPSALVIDDDPEVRRVLRHYLESDGWTVAEAENGKVGLERLAQRRPDVVLLDLMMPEMDGFMFLDEVRKQPALADLPITVVTAKELTAEDRTYLSGRVSQVLDKGLCSRDGLIQVISQLVGERLKTK